MRQKGKKVKLSRPEALLALAQTLLLYVDVLTKGNELKSGLAVLDSYDFEELVLGFGGKKRLENSKE